MADTPDFNTLPTDAANTGKKVSGVARLINSISVFIQNVRIANEVTDPVLAQIVGPVPVGYIANNGVVVPADSLAATHTIANGQITAITVSYLGITYVQTLTYTGGIVSAVSQWVAQ